MIRKKTLPAQQEFWIARQDIKAGSSGGYFDKLGILHEAGLLKGRKLGNDASTMEANASLESLVNRMSGESYWSYVRGLAEAAGVDTQDEVADARVHRAPAGDPGALKQGAARCGEGA